MNFAIQTHWLRRPKLTEGRGSPACPHYNLRRKLFHLLECRVLESAPARSNDGNGRSDALGLMLVRVEIGH